MKREAISRLSTLLKMWNFKYVGSNLWGLTLSRRAWNFMKLQALLACISYSLRSDTGHHRNRRLNTCAETYWFCSKEMIRLCVPISIIASGLTNLPLVPHTFVCESGQHSFRWWFVAYLAPSYYLNQRWAFVNCTIKEHIAQGEMS